MKPTTKATLIAIAAVYGLTCIVMLLRYFDNIMNSGAEGFLALFLMSLILTPIALAFIVLFTPPGWIILTWLLFWKTKRIE